MQYNILHLPLSQSETKFIRGSQHSPSFYSCCYWTSAHTTLTGLISWPVVKLWTITLRMSSSSLNIVWPQASWNNNSSRNSTWTSTNTYENRSVITEFWQVMCSMTFVIMALLLLFVLAVIFWKLFCKSGHFGVEISACSGTVVLIFLPIKTLAGERPHQGRGVALYVRRVRCGSLESFKNSFTSYCSFQLTISHWVLRTTCYLFEIIWLWKETKLCWRILLTIVSHQCIRNALTGKKWFSRQQWYW